MKKFLILFITLFFIFITGCTNSGSDVNKEEEPELLEVDLIAPEDIPVGDEVVLAAEVTQGEEKVEDADEVKFEVRKVGDEDSEMIKATHQGKGIYEIKKTFKEDGEYMLTAHVTARSMHNMPSEKITVGNPAGTGSETEHQHDESTDSHETGETAEGNHHHSHVSIDLDTNQDFKVNQKVNLSAQIKNDNQPLTDAAVRFEIWHGEDSVHEFVEAAEMENGVYHYETVFPKSGTYHIKVHVEKGEIHDHQEEEITVK
ncbi:FixH family protein [Mesobacillus selenatarsenatis]|uniref:FixH family protein n=1 Tax=Mesobacillus selenatarsenatis TaxID=388741 RepID=A0A846TPK7_9BACI|nr:FixH family protein [Mesobacillus selenatarsenatis]NKE07824.1 FixH family protein [Mesobacillus selenatarsenatis]